MEVAEAVDRHDWPYRMKDLCDLSGLPRQAIHFYIHEGLVPEGHKTGRNMAYYGESHLARLRLIQKLQDEQFLPLKAIRAVLDEQDSAFSPAQRRLIADVKQRLSPAITSKAGGKRETVDAKAAMLRLGVDRKDFDELVSMGLFAATKGPKGKTLIAKDDEWMLELWGNLCNAGFSRELGFSLLAIAEEAVSSLFARESQELLAKLAQVPADQVAGMIERALPLVNTFLVRYHETKIRNLLAVV